MQADQFAPYLTGPMDLIPLHKWDSVDDGGVERGKTPRDRDWPRREYTRAQIQAWATAGGNIGVRLREVDIVIDVDTKHDDAKGRSAAQLIAELERLLGIDLSKAPIVETGSGGWHMYMRRPADDGRIKKTLKEHFGGAIEFKSRGAQVLAAGCRHPNGNFYTWHRKCPVIKAPAELLDAIRKPKLEEREAAPTLDMMQLAQCLDQLDATDFREYDSWRDLMFSVHAAADGDLGAMEMFVGWCVADDQYTGHEARIEDMWRAAESRGVDGGRTARSLFWFASQAGGTLPANEVKMSAIPAPAVQVETAPPVVIDAELGVDNLPRNQNGFVVNSMLTLKRAMVILGVKPSYDTFALRQTVYLPKTSIEHGTHELGEDIALLVKDLLVRTWVWNREPSKLAIMEVLVIMSHDNKTHPVREWLDSLEWDGDERLDMWLIKNSELNDSFYAREVSRLLIFSAVARAYQPGIKWDPMIVMEGSQAGEKSMLVGILGGEWAAEGLPPLRSSGDKDVVDAMRGVWYVEIEELAVTRKAEQDVLKAFLSRRADRCRPPYGEKTRTFLRQCVFVGTTNDTTYLRDLTGNRRVLPIYVGDVKAGKIALVRDQLFAEAVVQWKKAPPATVNLPRHLWESAASEQEKRLVEDPWEQALIEYIDANRGKNFQPSNDILINSGLVSRERLNRGHTMKLSAVMQRLGVPKTRRSRDRVRGFTMPPTKEE